MSVQSSSEKVTYSPSQQCTRHIRVYDGKIVHDLRTVDRLDPLYPAVTMTYCGAGYLCSNRSDPGKKKLTVPLTSRASSVGCPLALCLSPVRAIRAATDCASPFFIVVWLDFDLVRKMTVGGAHPQLAVYSLKNESTADKREMYHTFIRCVFCQNDTKTICQNTELIDCHNDTKGSLAFGPWR